MADQEPQGRPAHLERDGRRLRESGEWRGGAAVRVSSGDGSAAEPGAARSGGHEPGRGAAFALVPRDTRTANALMLFRA